MMKSTLAVAMSAAAVVALTTSCQPAETKADPNITTSPKASPSPAGKAKASKPRKAAPDGAHTLVYKVTGTAKSAAITVTTPSGQQQTTERVPWTKTLKAEDGQVVGIFAQNKGSSGRLGCAIVLDGKVIKQNTSSGAYVVVTCDGFIGF